jgi:glycerol kinase
MTANNLLMQFQADVLGVPAIRPKVTETTALGAAYAAGSWSDQDELRARWAEDRRWEPAMDEDGRDREYARWKKAVARSLDCVE